MRKKSDLNFCLFAAPGGIILEEGENVCRTNTCLFGLADSMDKVKAFEQVFVKLMRRYTFLSSLTFLSNYDERFLIDRNDTLSTDLIHFCHFFAKSLKIKA